MHLNFVLISYTCTGTHTSSFIHNCQKICESFLVFFNKEIKSSNQIWKLHYASFGISWFVSLFQVPVRWYPKWLVPRGKMSCMWETTYLVTFYDPKNSAAGEPFWLFLNSQQRFMCGQTNQSCSTKSSPWNRPSVLFTSKMLDWDHHSNM